MAQLEAPPKWVLRFEGAARSAVAPGPGFWCTARDLHHGDAPGLSACMRPVQASCQAAMLRVHAWEGGAEGIDWGGMIEELTAAQRQLPDDAPLAQLAG